MKHILLEQPPFDSRLKVVRAWLCEQTLPRPAFLLMLCSTPLALLLALPPPALQRGQGADMIFLGAFSPSRPSRLERAGRLQIEKKKRRRPKPWFQIPAFGDSPDSLTYDPSPRSPGLCTGHCCLLEILMRDPRLSEPEEWNLLKSALVHISAKQIVPKTANDIAISLRDIQVP